MTAKIAINGFGRIGRASFKIAFDRGINIVAINDLINPRILAYLLKYDSAYGIYEKDIYIEENGKKIRIEDAKNNKNFFTETAKETYVVVNGKKSLILAEKDPEKLPWKELDIDVVLECTGFFTKNDDAIKHINAGSKNVIVSAPTKNGTIQTFLKGVNDSQYLGQNAISNASCTTNCVSPVVTVINSKFKVLKASLTTIHAVTAGQNIVDGPPNPLKPDLRRARTGWQNIVPTTTGAATATTDILPSLKGKFDGIAIRVPIITGSLIDVVMLTEKDTTIEEVNKSFEEAEKNPIYKGVLKTTWEPIVSSDIIGDTHSAIVDLSMTQVIDRNLVKVLSWYDNEWGYSSRLVDMAEMMAN